MRTYGKPSGKAVVLSSIVPQSALNFDEENLFEDKTPKYQGNGNGDQRRAALQDRNINIPLKIKDNTSKDKRAKDLPSLLRQHSADVVDAFRSVVFNTQEAVTGVCLVECYGIYAIF